MGTLSTMGLIRFTMVMMQVIGSLLVLLRVIFWNGTMRDTSHLSRSSPTSPSSSSFGWRQQWNSLLSSPDTATITTNSLHSKNNNSVEDDSMRMMMMTHSPQQRAITCDVLGNKTTISSLSYSDDSYNLINRTTMDENYHSFDYYFPKPHIDSYDAISVYSQKAWWKLRRLLQLDYPSEIDHDDDDEKQKRDIHKRNRWNGKTTMTTTTRGRSKASSPFLRSPSEPQPLMRLPDDHDNDTTTTTMNDNHHHPHNPAKKMMKKNVIMVINGGSTSAGAGGVSMEHRYYQSVVQAFPTVGITVIDRAHGARNSLHSAHAMHTFFPMHTDVVLWEFSINDIMDQITNLDIAAQEVRNQFVLWLDQLIRVTQQRNQSNPPLVLLVYLWSHHQWDGDHIADVTNDMTREPFFRQDQIDNFVYRAHQAIMMGDHDDAIQFRERYGHMIVGHINAGKYIKSFQCRNISQRYAFMVDPCHPNDLGHHIIYHLLNDLIHNKHRPERPSSTRTTISSSLSSPEESSNTQRSAMVTTKSPSNNKSIGRPNSFFIYQCGNDTHAKQQMQYMMEHRYPVASFAAEVPKNNEDYLEGMNLPGMIVPTILYVDDVVRDINASSSSSSLQVINVGKTDAVRSDRKYSILLPCCEARPQQRLVFANISERYGSIRGVVMNSLPFGSVGLNVSLDDGEDLTNQMVHTDNVTEWNCFASDSQEIFRHWILFHKDRWVSNLYLCNQQPTCLETQTNATEWVDLSVISLTVYGRGSDNL